MAFILTSTGKKLAFKKESQGDPRNFEENYKANVCNECSTVTPGFPTFKVGINDSHATQARVDHLDAHICPSDVEEFRSSNRSDRASSIRGWIAIWKRFV